MLDLRRLLINKKAYIYVAVKATYKYSKITEMCKSEAANTTPYPLKEREHLAPLPIGM
jgi:hypothetical protein